VTWLRIISTVAQGLASLVIFLRERNLLAAGEAQAAAASLEASNVRLRLALAAREAARNGPADPHDPYLRD
jgi:hypothetical protein